MTHRAQFAMLLVGLGAAALVACGDDAPSGDGGADDGGRMDASTVPSDAGPRADTGVDDVDAGPDDTDGGPDQRCETPGAVESVPCGSCGTVERFCNAAGAWVYGECEDQGECAPGTTGRIACGNCGARAARCTDTCTWTPTGACEDEGECAPGSTDTTSAGCPAGQSRGLTCNDACTFDAGECAPDGCTPGSTMTVACGMCGTRTRTCNGTGAWVDGACTGEGVCVPGTTGSQACGLCGTQQTQCTASCAWQPAGSCSGEGTCAPGSTSACTTTCGSTGTQACNASCDPGACVPPAEICNGVDDDCDGVLDEDCGCSVPGTGCGATEICACPALGSSCTGTGTCVPVFGEYALEVRSARLPASDPQGGCWDTLGCGPPDVLIDVRVDGVLVGTAPEVPNTRFPTWTPPSAFRVTLSNGSVVQLTAYDADALTFELAFSCTFTVTASALRSRAFTCTAGTDQVVQGGFVPYP